MISRLQSGDVLITLDSPLTPVCNREDAFHQVINKPDHGMVYRSSERGERIYHSSEGTYQAGVRSHELFYAYNEKSALGGCAVIRCKDPDLCRYFSEVVERFDPKLTKEELAERPKDKDIIRLPTPFINFFQRTRDASDRQEQHELFRAFRAHARNHANPKALPLSKEKGVSCSNFITYSFKAAIIDKLFPKGIPDEIDLLLSIEYPTITTFGQVDKTKPTNKLSKLSDIHIEFFDEFKENVKACINASKTVKEEMIDVYYRFLCAPVKGLSIVSFCKLVSNFPEIWEFKGVLCYQKEMNENGKAVFTPCVIDHSGYQTILAHQKKDPSIAIAKEELEQLGIVQGDHHLQSLTGHHTSGSLRR